MTKFATLLVAVLAVLVDGRVAAQDTQCLFEKNKNATVFIEHTYSVGADGKTTQQGTGFLVSSAGHILTNAHVVVAPSDGMKVIASTIKVRVGGRSMDPVLATVLPENIDEVLDLALIQLTPGARTTPWPTLAVSYLDNLPVGSSLTALGFPSGSDITITPPGLKTSDITYVDNEPKAWWQTSLPLVPGNSGGPIFGKLGTVVGIAIANNLKRQMTTYVIPLARAQHMLSKIKVEPLMVGACAEFPKCEHASHGIDRYTVDEPKSKKSDWRYGGGNPKASPEAWCSEYLVELQQQYPSSSFVKTGSDDEVDHDVPLARIGTKYRYRCDYNRLEGPIFKQLASAACIK